MAPIRNKNSSEYTQLRLLQKMKKKKSMQLNREKKRLDKAKAKAEEMAIKLAEWGREIERNKMEIACTNQCIHLILDIIDAKDEGDPERAEGLKDSTSE